MAGHHSMQPYDPPGEGTAGQLPRCLVCSHFVRGFPGSYPTPVHQGCLEAAGLPLKLPVKEAADVEKLAAPAALALRLTRLSARKLHEAALPGLEVRLQNLGYKPGDLNAALDWIRDEAPILVPCNLAACGKALVRDTLLRNQFETQSCDPLEEIARAEWENDAFGEAYMRVEPELRCKRGVLNLNASVETTLGHSCGESMSYLLLTGIRYRATFSEPTCQSRCRDRLATVEYFAHVLSRCTDSELHAVIRSGLRRAPAGRLPLVVAPMEAQLHGEVRLAENVELILANPSLRAPQYNEMLAALSARCQAPVTWISHAEVPASPANEEWEMELAFKESAELAKRDSRRAADDDEDEQLARALALSLAELEHPQAAPSIPDEEEQMKIALALSVAAPAEAKERLATASYPSKPPSRILKARLDEDTRRMHVGWPEQSVAGEVFGAIGEAVRKAFGHDLEAAVGEVGHLIFKYEDDDGEPCTLAEGTVEDYLSFASATSLPRLTLRVVVPPVVVEETPAVPQVREPESAECLPEVEAESADESADVVADKVLELAPLEETDQVSEEALPCSSPSHFSIGSPRRALSPRILAQPAPSSTSSTLASFEQPRENIEEPVPIGETTIEDEYAAWAFVAANGGPSLAADQLPGVAAQEASSRSALPA
mmetsp:Transcript_26179/g.57578  ORF Transcript_26179/g.57578 Transcript_26179/m.57578 type:complete len:660 (-) Transcript_26179:206-2185(-)